MLGSPNMVDDLAGFVKVSNGVLANRAKNSYPNINAIG